MVRGGDGRRQGGGYVLDEIPRNMQQARAAYLIARDLSMTADVAPQPDADDAEVTRRLLAGRARAPLR
jgi:adenylate kinase